MKDNLTEFLVVDRKTLKKALNNYTRIVLTQRFSSADNVSHFFSMLKGPSSFSREDGKNKTEDQR